jgi:hypothetical protein
MLDIRTYPTDESADLWTEEQQMSYINYAGALAYLFHSLALEANDFETFEEERFWNALQAFNRRRPLLAANHLQKVFNDRLEELKSKQ